jgi:glycine/D-amino acid oxidase-like deaminating enzyme
MARTLRHSEGQIGTVTPDVAIVGEGVAGRMPAYEPAGRGARVAVFERDRIGGEAAKAAAGILPPLGAAWGRR